jgi:putative drug exporter of the RND superfamily
METVQTRLIRVIAALAEIRRLDAENIWNINREHYDLTGNNTESVAVGLQSTAKIITGAALIIVAVFGGFAAGRLVPLQQLGFGLGAAILIDATIIRSILVPSAMALLGDRNWYLPRWLGWLPDLRVEGAPAPGAAPTPLGGPFVSSASSKV